MRLVRFEHQYGQSVYVNPDKVESVWTEHTERGPVTAIKTVSGCRIAVKDTLEVAAFKLISGCTQQKESEK